MKKCPRSSVQNKYSEDYAHITMFTPKRQHEHNNNNKMGYITKEQYDSSVVFIGHITRDEKQEQSW
jgi:hypothetical protein